MYKPYADCDKYLIYDDGRVYSLKRNKFLTPRVQKGYFIVTLHVHGKVKCKYIHRLVAETFIPNPLNLETVNHKDENRLNNSVSNLEWMSRIDNLNYGTGRKRAGEKKRGGNNGRAKAVRQYSLDGTLIQEYPSGADAALALNKYPQGIKNINACVKGRVKTAYGYKWKQV